MGNEQELAAGALLASCAANYGSGDLGPEVTPAAFCHWLEGYSEHVGKKPTIAQWKRITEKLDDVDCSKSNPIGFIGQVESDDPDDMES